MASDKAGLIEELDRVRAKRSSLRCRLAAAEYQMARILGQSAEEVFLGHETTFVTDSCRRLSFGGLCLSRDV